MQANRSGKGRHDSVAGLWPFRAWGERRTSRRRLLRRQLNQLNVQPLESRCVLSAAPVLVTTPAPELPTMFEDAVSPVGQVGTLVSSLVDTGGPLNNFSDADGDLPGIAITGTNLQGGTLWFSVDGGGSWLDVGPVNVSSPRYLAANAFTRLYFQPGDNFNGTITDVISFKAWDRTGILQQLGLDIDGEAAGDYSGWSVSLSADGSTVAIGAIYSDGNGPNSGHTRIFRWTGSAWVRLGSDIDGEAVDDNSGYSVSLSADGSTVAIGAPYNDGNGSFCGHTRIFRWTGSAWVQLGSDIDGEATGDLSGYSVSLSADGSTVAIGAPSNDGNGLSSGHTRIFRWNGSAWGQVGADIDGEAADDASGLSVSLSADGSTVAIGAMKNGGNGFHSGQVRIHRWTGSVWAQLGADIDGEAALDWSGFSVSLSADGSTVAIGAPSNDGNGPSSGHTRIFRWTGVAWVQLGSDIDGEAAGDSSGLSVSLSADGSTVAIGAPYNGLGSGHTRIFRWTGVAWVQVAADIDGETTYDDSGSAVSLSADGSTVAIGAIFNDGTSDDQIGNSGHVRVYRLVPQNTSVSAATDAVSVGVTALADAPVLVTTPVLQLPTILEDPGAPVGAVGVLVSSLVATGGPLSNFSDADGDLPGIAITGTNLQGGTLWFSVDGGGSWLDVGPVNVSSPRYLAANAFTRLYFQPGDNFNGTITDVLSFKAWDRTGILQQIGGDIDGEAAGDRSGFSVSLSADGSTVAIGAPYNDGNGTNAGQVRIYRWNGTIWTRLGADIDGEAARDESGFAVSLSADGSTVAIGAPDNDANGSYSGHVRIYRWNGTAWVQLGADIDGEAVYDESGWSVSLSADGSTVAIGAPHGLPSGHARIFRWTGVAWVQVGADIDGEATGDLSGWSVSLSADGSTVAIGARENGGNGLGSGTGHTRIFCWTGSVWAQLGTDIDGEAVSDLSGYSVSLSADGSTVAIGAPLNDVNGDSAGRTRIFRWNGLAWGQLGAAIDGEAADDSSGWSVSLSADGSTVAIGARENGGNGWASGHARIFRWTGVAWVQLGADIDGEATVDWSGYAVSLSADGSTVAIGAPNNDANGFQSGHVRVYRLVPQNTSVSVATDTVSVAVAPVNDAPTALNLTGTTVPENSPIGLAFGLFATVDGDAGDTFTYSFVAGPGDTDNAAFAIVGNQLQLATQPNFERQAAYTVRVRSTDAGGLSIERPFTITVADVAEAPAVDHVIAPSAGSYRVGQPLQFTAVLTQPVTQVGRGGVTLPVVVGRSRVNATLVAGLGTNRLTFQYVPKKTDNDADGVVIGPAITLPRNVFLRDGQGRNLALGLPPTSSGGVLVDNTAPSIRSLIAPAAGTYGTGDVLTFTAVLSERVTVSGTPALSLKIGAVNRLATYVSGSGTTTLVFRYVVQSGDAAPRGITVGSRLVLSAASITDAAGNGLLPTFRVPATRGVLVTPIPRPLSVAFQAAFAGLQ